MMVTTSTGLTSEYQTYFDKQLLAYAKPLTVTAQFAQKKPFPKNRGAKTVRFFRPPAPDRSRVVSLVEGVPPANYNEITFTPIDVTLAQYGEPVKISDILDETDLFDTLDTSIRTMGEDAGVHADFKCVTEVATNVNALNKRYGNLQTSYGAAGKLIIKDLLGSFTRLTKTRAKKPEGREYACIVAPEQAYDLMDDSKFIDVGTKREGNNGIFEGEIGRWYGNRILQTTEGWISSSEGTYLSTGDHYTALILGREALGSTVMAGQSPFSPSIIVNNQADSGNPLKQFVTAGWKAYWATVMLNDLWAVTITSTTTYV
jgi:N4-gp56 family major capsid protein